MIIQIPLSPKNPFSERYRALSNAELLLIVDLAKDYTPQAVTAARAELMQRQLSEEELRDAREELKQQKEEQDLQNDPWKETIQVVEDTVPRMLYSFSRSVPTKEKLIRSITIFFGLVSLFLWYQHFSLVQFMFRNAYAKWDFFTIVILVPLVYVPSGTVLFWKRKELGWILLSLYTIWTLTFAAFMLFGFFFTESSDRSLSDFFTAGPFLGGPLLSLLLFGGVVGILNHGAIRAEYRIDRRKARFTLLLSALVGLLFLASVFLG
ncbi:MAG: hypothetical protein ACFB10_21720 [Salibacteraceae bacterium]